MASHSSILAWEVPWTEEPDCLQSRGSQKSGHNLATKQRQQRKTIRETWLIGKCGLENLLSLLLSHRLV